MSSGNTWHLRENLEAAQIAALVLPGVGATLPVFIPPGLAEVAGRDAWLVPWVAMGYAFAVVWVVLALNGQRPGKSPVLVVEELFGPFGRLVFGLFYGSAALLAVAVAAHQIGDFLVFTVLPRTPRALTVGALMLLAVWALRQGPETVGRLAAFLIAAILTATALVFLLSLGRMDFDHLSPVLSGSPLGLLHGAALASPFYGELFFLAWYLPHVRSGAARSPLYWASAIISLVISTLLVGAHAAFGPEIVVETTAPVYRLLREAGVGEFIERIDVAFLAVWQLAFFLKLCYLLYPAASSLAEAFRLSDYRPLLFPLGIMATVSTTFLFGNIREETEFLQGPAIPFGLLAQFIIPLALLVIVRIRRPAGGSRRRA